MRIQPTVWPAIVWLTISTFLLILPGSSLPKNDWMGKLWLDKWIHVGLFAIMVFLWCWAMTRFEADPAKRKKRFLLIAILCLAYGIGMEFVQKYLVVNRSFDEGDILADAGGCIAGWVFSGRRYIKK